MPRLVNLLVCVVMLLGAMERIAAQEKPVGPPFSPGEVIVKFSAKSQAAELSARASALGNPADAELSSYIRSLSAEVGIPFAAKQLGSGGTLIVAIRQSDLLSDLLKRLGKNPNIKDSHVVSGQSPPAIEIHFKENSPEAKALAEAAKESGESGHELQALTAKLQADCRFAVTTRVVSPLHLQLSPDLQRLTLDLVARLSKRPDIEYAQPNFIRHPIGSASNASPK